MQTFLPYPSFEDTARVLDRRRLGKQRVETLQIMSALMTGSGWVHHPATKMWRGYEYSLFKYQEAICHEWMRQGYYDSCLVKTGNLFFDISHSSTRNPPPWLGDESFHISHQSNLLRKDPEFYGRVFDGVPDDLDYVWPV